MEKSLQEVLYENKMRIQAKRKAQLKKQQLKENILFSIVALFIVIITVMLINVVNQDMENCVEAHGQNYCVEHL